MKKIFALFIAIIILISMTVLAFGIETVGTISITGIDEAKKSGDTFTVGVNISDNPNIGAIIFDIDYDKERLEFLGSEDSGLKGWTVSSSAVWVSAKGSSATGEILKLNFKVKESSPDGFAYISVSNVDCATLDEKLVNYNISASGVNVGNACAHKNKAKHSAIPSTCLEQGNNEYYTCNDCGAVLKSDGKTLSTLEGEKLPLAEHSLGKLVSEKASTCEEEGLEAHYTCSVCGLYFNENREQVSNNSLVIMKTLHQFGEGWYGDEKNHWHECEDCGTRISEEEHTPSETEVTCTEGIYCIVCNRIITPKAGHIDANGDKICDVCGVSWKELPIIDETKSSLSYKQGTDDNICIFVKNLIEDDIRYIMLNDYSLSMNDYEINVTEEGATITIRENILNRISSGETKIVISTVFCELETTAQINKADPKNEEESAGNVINIPENYSLNSKDGKKNSAAIIVVLAIAAAGAGAFVALKKKKQ